MTHQITIPTEARLARHLGGLETLLTAKRWERAAVVYAFTTDEGKGGRPPKASDTERVTQFPVSIGEFSRMGFAGLGSRGTVGAYRRAWTQAIEEGFAEPTFPGQTITLPDEADHPWEVQREAPVEPVAPAALSLVPDEPEGDDDARDEPYDDELPENTQLQLDDVPEEEDVEPREPRKVPQGARPQTRIEQTRVDDVDYVVAKVIEMGQDYGTMPMNTWLRRIAAALSTAADEIGRGDQAQEADAQTA